MATIYVSATGNDTNSGTSSGSPKTLSGGISAASGGDTISMADGTYARLDLSGKTLHFVATTTPTAATVPGFAGGHPARLNRGVIVNEATITSSADSSFTNLWFKWNKWVDTTNSETFESVYGVSPPQGIVMALSGGHAPIFTGCEFSWGYGPTQDPFDTNTVYPEFQSGAYATVLAGSGNVTGRGDTYQSWWIRDDTITGSAPPANTNIPNGRAYNTIGKAPPAFYTGNFTLRAAQFYACHFHDLHAGMVYYCDQSPFVVDQCWFERIYVDAMTGGQSTHGLTSPYGLQVTRTIIEGPFGDSKDSGNPHSDFLQTFSNWTIPDPSHPMRYGNVRLERNFGLIRPSDRGFFQFLFLQGAASHDVNGRGVTYWNPIVRDNASLQHNSDKGLLMDSVHDGLVEYNCLLSMPGVTSTSTTALTLSENPNTKSSGVALVQNNIVENGSLLPTAHGVSNVSAGKNYAQISAASLMVGPFNLTGVNDYAANWYDSMARQTTYAGKGPRYATLEDLVTDALIVSDMPVFVGFADQRECALGATVTTDGSVIRGPLGDTVDISVDKGEFQIEDINGGVLNAWRSSSLSSVAVGSVLRLRQPASASFTTTTVQTASLVHSGSTFTFTFTISTLSNVVLPTVAIPTTVQVGNSGSTNMGTGTSSHRFTFAMRFTPTAIPTGGSYALYGHTTGITPVHIRMVTTGKIRISAKDSSGTVLFGSNWDSATAAQVNHEYLLIISVDFAAGASACTAKAWDLTDGTSHLTWGSPSVSDGVLGFHQNHHVQVNFSSNGCAPNVNFVYLDNSLNIDANSSAAFLLFANAYLGPNGEGPTGSAPMVFLSGVASDWNATGGINRGTGLKFIKTTTGITDVESPTRPYPPVLDLHADPQALGPYPVNTPLDFLVYPQGYGVAVNVTPSSDKTGTWSASPLAVPAGEGGATLTFTPTQTGNHTITFTNSVGYNNPASQVLVVI